MFQRVVLLRREDDPVHGPQAEAVAAVQALLRNCLGDDAPDTQPTVVAFTGNLGLLQQTGFGAADLIWFVPDEIVDLANHAKWADRLMCTVNRPALVGILFENSAAKAQDFARVYADRCYSTRNVDEASVRIATRDAAANRARRALMTALADQAADTGSFTLPGSLRRDEAAETDATRLLPRTATGAWALNGLPDDAPPGTAPALQVPGYRIVSHIGAGGMAEVFLAQRPTSKEIVVIKVVYRDRCPDPNGIRRFIQEFTLISRTRSPHIVQIYERGFLPDSAYIAMEHLPAGDLAQRISRGLPPADALEYARQIAHGLSDVHRLGVIHRDLKPANILFRRNGTLAITDFGIAKVRDGSARLTFNDGVVCTPYYTSPETIRGQELDQRADLYSLGVLLFEMLTGRRPYQADSLAGLLEAHLHAAPAQLPAHLTTYQPLVNELLAKDPARRIDSADAVLDRLHRLKAAA
jgi:tRNA A-37 threonylcarbamoyl transferase component Bud32